MRRLQCKLDRRTDWVLLHWHNYLTPPPHTHKEQQQNTEVFMQLDSRIYMHRRYWRPYCQTQMVLNDLYPNISSGNYDTLTTTPAMKSKDTEEHISDKTRDKPGAANNVLFNVLKQSFRLRRGTCVRRTGRSRFSDGTATNG